MAFLAGVGSKAEDWAVGANTGSETWDTLPAPSLLGSLSACSTQLPDTYFHLERLKAAFRAEAAELGSKLQEMQASGAAAERGAGGSSGAGAGIGGGRSAMLAAVRSERPRGEVVCRRRLRPCPASEVNCRPEACQAPPDGPRHREDRARWADMGADKWDILPVPSLVSTPSACSTQLPNSYFQLERRGEERLTAAFRTEAAATAADAQSAGGSSSDAAAGPQATEAARGRSALAEAVCAERPSDEEMWRRRLRLCLGPGASDL